MIEAALREIAVHVARGASAEEVFATISEQAAAVCGVSAAAVVRFADGGAEIVGRWGSVDVFPAGTAFPLGAGGALTLVRDTGLPARFDEYERTGEDAAVGALATRTPVPVEYDVVEERLPEALEVAAYSVIAEAITNAVEYADASVIRVTVIVGDRLALSVADDGRDGAVEGEGSGLVGLRDRVEALRGRLRVRSSPAAGTTISAEFPLEIRDAIS